MRKFGLRQSKTLDTAVGFQELNFLHFQRDSHQLAHISLVVNNQDFTHAYTPQSIPRQLIQYVHSPVLLAEPFEV